MTKIARIAGVAITALVCAWLLVRFAYAPVDCNRRITELERRELIASQTRSDLLRLERVRRNLADLRAVEKRCGLDVRLYSMMASSHEMLGQYEEAVASYERALAVDQRPEVHQAMALVLLRLGRFEEAAQHYAITVRFLHLPLTELPSDPVRARVAEILREQP